MELRRVEGEEGKERKVEERAEEEKEGKGRNGGSGEKEGIEMREREGECRWNRSHAFCFSNLGSYDSVTCDTLVYYPLPVLWYAGWYAGLYNSHHRNVPHPLSFCLSVRRHI